MLALSLSDGYTLFLNPRFRWLTAAGGGSLVLLGAAAFLSRRRRPEKFRVVSFLAFVGLVFLVVGPSFSSPKNSGVDDKAEATKRPRLEFRGASYVKINTAALFFMLREGDSTKMSQPYVVRGVVKRSPEMDRQGRFALLRTNIVCCMADAMAMGLVVSQADPQQLPDGRWVKVFGRLRPLKIQPPAAVKVEGAIYAVISDQALLAAEAVERIERPTSPYIFVLTADEPYTY